jgi:nucleoside-diphosphate-sugar epimerase
MSDGLPRMIVTGASGFVGRHLLEALKNDWHIYGLARRSQARAGAPIHPNIHWYQVDIGDARALGATFRNIRAHGGADVCIHLAAYYDFIGEDNEEYERTNVLGTRNVLDACRGLGIRHFVFSSSVAACSFPKPGAVVTEDSPADGRHVYARTKRAGEDMLAEYAGHFHSIIVRFAALFSDWCEYPPLFMFMQTWLSRVWNHRVLGGRGESAIPYLHIHELWPFFLNLLDRLDELPDGQVLIASPDGAVTHRQLFDAVTYEVLGRRVEPILMPRMLCEPGIRLLNLVGPAIGHVPFEKPWMAQYIDRALTVDARRSRELLDWTPRPRLEILRRLPFLTENLKMDPVEWNRRNRAALKGVRLRSNLLVHQLLEKHEEAITADYTRALTGPEGRERFPSYQYIAADEHEWNHRLVLLNLMNAVRTRERAVFLAYCRGLAERRFQQGFSNDEVCGALLLLNDIAVAVLHNDPEARGLGPAIFQHVTMTLRAGVDQVEESFEDLQAARMRREQRVRHERATGGPR